MTKELLFALNASNYIKFLQAILLECGLTNYEVTKKNRDSLRLIDNLFLTEYPL